jgi:gliding motility-associated-like protein
MKRPKISKGNWLLTAILIFTIHCINAQCDVSNFTVTPTSGTCFANASIAVQVPGATSCNNWVAILTHPDNSQITLAIPANGGPVVFGSLAAGDYEVNLFNGITTISYASNPVSVTSSYTNMDITSSQTENTCSLTDTHYTPDGELAITINNGGVGPFIYEVTSSLGVQSFGPSMDTSHTFGGMPDTGEQVSFTVTDQASGNPGCEVRSTQTPTLIRHSVTPSTYAQFASSLSRDCTTDCNTWTATFRVGSFLYKRATLIQPGNSSISINGGAPQPFDEALEDRSGVTFRANMAPGDTFDLFFTDGCNDITISDVAPPFNDSHLETEVNTFFDSNTCSSSIQFQPDLFDIGNSTFFWKNNFCENYSSLMEQESSPGNWAPIGLPAHPAGGFELPGPGRYRFTASDMCHSVPREFDVAVPSNNAYENYRLVERRSLLEGTSGIEIRDFGSFEEGTLEVRPVPFVSQMTINPAHPYNLAGSYTINFPIVIPFIPSRRIGDLPPGEYEITINGNCGSTFTDRITLVAPAQYDPQIQTSISCINSNSIIYDFGMVDASIPPPTFPSTELWTDNGSGGPGTRVASTTQHLSGAFNNLPFGDYIIRCPRSTIGDFDPVPPQYSAATGNEPGTREYFVPVTISPYQDITVSTGSAFCGANSATVTAQITSGTPAYPLTYQLFATSNPGTPLASYIANDPGDASATAHTFGIAVTTGDYFVRVSSSCYSVDTNINVNTLQQFQIATDNDNFCPGSTAMLSIPLQPFAWDITWSDDQGNTVDTEVSQIQVTPSTTTTYTVSYASKPSASCPNPTPFSDNITITVNPQPTVPILTGNNAVCSGEDAIFTISGTPGEIVTYSGSVSGTATIGAGGTVDIPVNGITADATLNLTLVDNGICPLPLTLTETVSVNALPTITVSSMPACSADLLIYSLEISTSATTVNSTSGTVSNTSGNTWTITDVPAGTDITLTAMDANACVSNIAITAPDCSCPVVNAPVSGGDMAYCAGTTIPTLMAAIGAGETVDWYDAPSGGTLLVSDNVNYIPVVPGTYYAEARNTTTNCTSATRTPITITQNALPTVTFDPVPSTCIDATVTDLTSLASPAGGTFSGTGVTGNSFDPAVAGLGTHILTYTYTDGNGCTNTDTTSITVNALPTITVSSAPVCSADLLTYSLEISTSAAMVNSTSGTVSNISGNIWTITGISAGTDITITVTDANSCDTILPVTAPDCSCPTVNAPVSGGDLAYCAGTTIPTLMAAVNAGETVDWYNAPSGGTLLVSDNVNYVPVVPGTYYAEARDTTTNCTSATRTPVTVVENALPTVAFGPVPSICIDAGPMDLASLASPAGGTFSGTGVVGNTFDPATAGTGIHTLTYSFTDGNGCTNIETTSVTVNTLPSVDFTTIPNTCIDATVTDLTSFASPTGGTFSGIGVTGNSFNPAVAGIGTHTLTYSFTDGNGCTNTDITSIIVNNLVSQVGTTATSCALDGTSYTLTIELNGTAAFMATGSGAPGTFVGTTWTSDPIAAGTDYSVDFQDIHGCNTLTIADVAPVCCVFDVSCPTFPTTEVQCYEDLPTATMLTEAEFEALGNGDGDIGDIPCGIIEIIADNSPDSGNCNVPVIRTYTVTEYQDGNGNGLRDQGENVVLNTTSCTQTITINDTTAPIWTNAPSDRIVECSGIMNTDNAFTDWLNSFSGTDTCGTTVVTHNSAGLSDFCGATGTETVTFTLTDECGNSISQEATFSVVDTTAPDFVETLPINITLECDAAIPLAEILTATDICGTALVAFNEVRIDGSCDSDYTLERSWTATDQCGNTAIHVQTITVQDTTAPTFVGELPQDSFAQCSSIPEAPQLTAMDNCGSVEVTFMETEIPGDCTNRFTLMREWVATDACGNETVHTQNIQLACEIEIFNAVTPNGDGANDVFFLKGIDCYPNNNVKIFNRWGVKVFEVNDYDNSFRAFDGISDARATINTDNRLPSGTYFYILEYEFTDNGGAFRPIQQSGYLYLQGN